MSPRPAPDLDHRRGQVLRTARRLAESDGWPAVTMRRLAGELGVTQPVIYSVFAGRQDLVDAVAVDGFGDLARALEATQASSLARMRAYLAFAAEHPRVYEAMFSMPLGLPFASDETPEPLHRAFGALREGFPGVDETRAEVVWSTLHGLATLRAGGRLRGDQAAEQLVLAHVLLTQPVTR